MEDAPPSYVTKLAPIKPFKEEKESTIDGTLSQSDHDDIRAFANSHGWKVLSTDVNARFTPFNAIIRLTQSSVEGDRVGDFLAAFDPPPTTVKS